MTLSRPSKSPLFKSSVILIIRRATSFFAVFSARLLSWQNSHSTPSDAEITRIVGRTSELGMSLSTWMFGDTCPAVAVAGACGR